MKWFSGTIAVAVLTLAPTAAFAQKVSTDFDPVASFAKYKTYAWAEGTKSPNPLGEDRIHQAVETRMAAAGFTKAAGNPDVFIATHAVGQEEKEIITTGYGYGGGYYRYGGMGGMTTSSVNTYIKGTLVLDMYDASTKKLVWRGTGTDTVSDKAEKNAKKVDKALQKMFKEYPPTPPKAKP
jgi:Domain of unknown function (DUF4136)